MTPMLKRTFKSHNVLLVVWVSLLQLVENLDFFQACSVPRKKR